MQLGGSAYAGTGQVIGVIDSGIDWDNPSFSAEGMPNAPDGFNGSCEVEKTPTRGQKAPAPTKLSQVAISPKDRQLMAKTLQIATA